MSSAAATVSCRGLPRTHHRLPFPTSWGLVLEALTSASPSLGLPPQPLARRPCPHPLGCGTRVQSGRSCTPHHSIPPIPAAPHLPLPPSALVSHPTAHPLSWPQGPPPTQALGAPGPPGMVQVSLPTSAAQGWLLPHLSVVILFPL